MKDKRVLLVVGIVVVMLLVIAVSVFARNHTAIPTDMPEPTAMDVSTEAPTATSTPEPTNTTKPELTATNAPTVVLIATDTPMATPTNMPVPIETLAPIPEPTATKALQETLTSTPEPIATSTPEPTTTNTLTPTNTPMLTNKPTPTQTPTPTNTSTPTTASTNAPSPANTKAPEETLKPSPSPCPTNTPRLTITPKSTTTPTPTSRPTPSFKFSGSVSDVTIYNENPKEYKFNIKDETDEELYIDCTSNNDYVVNVYMEELMNGYYDYKFVVIGRESGTADITFAIYGKDSIGGYNLVYDTKTITVTIELEEAVTSPLTAYPVFEAEWKYGDDVTVQMWSDGVWNAALYVTGTGAMWSAKEANATDAGWAPWHSSDFVGDVIEIYVSEGITQVEDLGLPTAKTLSLPSTLRVIGDTCFSNGAYTSIILPEGVEILGYGAFLHCDYLSYVKLPSTLKSIGMGAFEGIVAPKSDHKSLLREIFIPKSVTFIDYAAFGFRWDMIITLEDGIDTSGFDQDWDIDTDYNYY